MSTTKTQKNDPTSEKLVLSESDLDRLGVLSRPTRYRLRRQGDFPRPVKLSRGGHGYLRRDIEEWLAARPRKSR